MKRDAIHRTQDTTYMRMMFKRDTWMDTDVKGKKIKIKEKKHV